MTDQHRPPLEDYSHLSATGQRLVARLRAETLARVEREHPASVLEVGCGQGWLLASVAEALPEARLDGLDIREDALALARTLVPSATFIVGDAARLPYEDGSFDMVVCSEVLEHVAEPSVVLAEIRRVGRGRAVLSVPHEPWFWGANLIRGKHRKTLGNFPGHIHHFTRGGFQRLLGRAYAEVEVVSSFPWLVAEVRW